MSGLEHRSVGLLICLAELAIIEEKLGLESIGFGSRESELSERNHLAGTLADAHVADGELARIAPVAVEAGVDVVRRDRREFVEHFLEGFLANPAAEGLE